MKRMSLKKILCSALVGTMVLTLTACGNSGKNDDTSSVEQIFKGTISSEPTILDPYQAQDTVATNLSYSIHEPLFRISGEGGKDWEPGLATEYEVNDDATVYTVKLRKDGVWSDDTPITADDVVYSFQRVVDPEFASPKANDYFDLKNAESIIKGEKDKSELGVKALDEYTVEFTLEKPVAYFIDCLKTPAYAPIQKKTAEEFKDLYGTEPENIVCSGPFKISKWTHENSITLVKNDKYWDAESVALKEIELSITADKNAIQGMYETGELDLRTIGSEEISKYENSSELEICPRLTSSFIELNPRIDFLSNIKIREALSIAFDRKTYATNVIKNEKLAAYGMVPYGIVGLDNGDFREQQGNLVVDAATDKNAIDRANKLLEEGLSELGKTKKDMEGFLQILCVDSDSAKLQAQAVQAMWKENLGIELSVSPMQVKMLIPMLVEGTFHCVIGGGNTANYPDASEFLEFIYNEGKLNDPKFNSLMEKSFETIGNERIQALMDAEKYVLEQYIYIPQNFAQNNYLISEKVEGLQIWPFGVEFDYKYAKKVE